MKLITSKCGDTRSLVKVVLWIKDVSVLIHTLLSFDANPVYSNDYNCVSNRTTRNEFQPPFTYYATQDTKGA